LNVVFSEDELLGGYHCSEGPNNRHRLAPAGMRCIFCDREGELLNEACGASPTEKHQLT